MRRLVEALMRIMALTSTLLFATCMALAQPVPTETEALKDADYALRRFEEVTAHIDFSRWRAPGDLVGKTQDGLKLVRTTYVEDAKSILARFDSRRGPTSTELLDIMFDLERVGVELDDLEGSASNLQDPDTLDLAKAADRATLSHDLTSASSTAQKAMANVFFVVRQRIQAEEELLEVCAQADNQKQKKGAAPAPKQQP